MILATRGQQDCLEDIAEQVDRFQKVSNRSVAEVTVLTGSHNLTELVNKLTLRVEEIEKHGRLPPRLQRQ